VLSFCLPSELPLGGVTVVVRLLSLGLKWFSAGLAKGLS
jgi:hypothetical protein